ncbi:MAG: methionyl-tRNA formyltransferase [Candidatus Omnitrophica bacterium]|nr:methionyl-tRNA formyltransferase [Candidatus Omnitrophota bacterium]
MNISDNKKYIIATIKPWNIDNARKFLLAKYGRNTLLLTNNKELTYKRIRKINPRYIFFPHWSWIIPDEIYKNYECVVFHMTDLPFGRGGSPLQNLIERGIYKTKITAIKVVKKLDAGPIYLKRSLALDGSAAQIFKKASQIVFKDMIPYIIKNEPIPAPQRGKVVKFKRRTPEMGNVRNLNSVRKIYDYIRMLDAESYPPAFLETSRLRIEFSDAKLRKYYVLANAKVRMKNEQ